MGKNRRFSCILCGLPKIYLPWFYISYHFWVDGSLGDSKIDQKWAKIDDLRILRTLRKVRENVHFVQFGHTSLTLS